MFIGTGLFALFPATLKTISTTGTVPVYAGLGRRIATVGIPGRLGVAGIGVACGAGLYTIAVITTLTAITILLGLRRAEKHLRKYLKKQTPKPPTDKQN